MGWPDSGIGARVLCSGFPPSGRPPLRLEARVRWRTLSGLFRSVKGFVTGWLEGVGSHGLFLCTLNNPADLVLLAGAR